MSSKSAWPTEYAHPVETFIGNRSNVTGNVKVCRQLYRQINRHRNLNQHVCDCFNERGGGSGDNELGGLLETRFFSPENIVTNPTVTVYSQRDK